MVNNKQGCYQCVSAVLNLLPESGSTWTDYSLKVELIVWLDSASGASPKENWLAKMSAIKDKTGANNLLLVSNEIVGKEELQKHFFNANAYWNDDVCKRFIKSAKWIKEYLNKT